MLTHLACVMDGNRRWAKKRGLFAWDGHREGMTAAQRVVDYCLLKGISYLTLYTFSIENFKRSLEEKGFLFDLILRFTKETLLSDYGKRGVRIQFIGDRTLFPEKLRGAVDLVESKTAHGTTLTVQLLFCYGGQQEIVAAASQLARKVVIGELLPEEITQDVFTAALWTGSVPPPDMIVRTGGKHRLSNFLLYQSAYSELYFSDTLWPDVNESFLDEAVAYFDASKRNFGA